MAYEDEGPKDLAGLSPRQQRFIEEYLTDLNASGAARRAGYAASDSRARGYDLLRNPLVAKAIAERRKNLADAAGLTQLGILIELRRIVEADLTEFIEGGCEDIKLIDPAVLQSISKNVTAMGGSSTKIKLKDGLAAIDRICKILGWYAPEKIDLTTKTHEEALSELE